MSKLTKFLDKCQADADAATPGPWRYDSYGKIFASVHKDHAMNIADDDEPPVAIVLGGGKIANFEGDDIGLACREAAANCGFAARARTDVPKLVAMLRVAIRQMGECCCGDPPYFGRSKCHTCRLLAKLEGMCDGE